MIVGRTSPFEALEMNITVKNIRGPHVQCPANKNNPEMLVLTQSAAAHMAGGNCKPFCGGIQKCDVITIETSNEVETRTLQCRCRQDTCRDLAIYLPAGTTADHTVPRGMCYITTRLINWDDAKYISEIKHRVYVFFVLCYDLVLIFYHYTWGYHDCNGAVSIRPLSVKQP